MLILAVSLDRNPSAASGGLTMAVEMPALSPVERNSLADQVAKKILDLVRTGNLKPGDQLPTERDLAQMLQVSRPSVREAMRGLQILGVVKTRQGGGAYISSLDAADLLGPLQFLITLNAQNVDALYESRVLIDGGIARHGGGAPERRRISTGSMRSSSSSAISSTIPSAFVSPDLEFHRTIMEARATRSSCGYRIRSMFSAWSIAGWPPKRLGVIQQSRGRP